RRNPYSAALKEAGRRLPRLPLPPERMLRRDFEAISQACGANERLPHTILVSSFHCIFQAKFKRVHTQPIREHVHHLLDGRCNLSNSEAPEGPADRIVGIYAPGSQSRVRNTIRASGMFEA